MRIALSTDHTGLELLQKLREHLTEQGHECMDFGPKEFNPDDDYPDLISKAAEAVGNGAYDYGIILGGSGQGEAMAANRFKGVRCAVYYGPATATQPIDADGTVSQDQYDILRLTRKHNHSNMLSLAARFLTWPDLEKAVTIWLETPYSEAERHIRRVQKLG